MTAPLPEPTTRGGTLKYPAYLPSVLLKIAKLSPPLKKHVARMVWHDFADTPVADKFRLTVTALRQMADITALDNQYDFTPLELETALRQIGFTPRAAKIRMKQHLHYRSLVEDQGRLTEYQRLIEGQRNDGPTGPNATNATVQRQPKNFRRKLHPPLVEDDPDFKPYLADGICRDINLGFLRYFKHRPPRVSVHHIEDPVGFVEWAEANLLV